MNEYEEPIRQVRPPYGSRGLGEVGLHTGHTQLVSRTSLCTHSSGIMPRALGLMP